MSEHHEVVIVGGGISGIGAGIELRRAGVEDVLILEKAASYGGTWRANTYPGCACDVPSDLYSYSFARNGDWSRVYGNQPEILAYVDRVARDHGLEDVTRFGVEMLSAHWDVAGRLWHLQTTDGELTSRFVIAAAGPWNEPNIPELPGLSAFPGPIWHSERWDHDTDLDGLTVAVIGSGASAVQFVPEIRRRVAQLHLFQRTPHWVLPKFDHPIPDAEKWAKRRLPGFGRAVTAAEYAAMEAVGTAFHHPRPAMEALERIGRAYLRITVRDPELRAKLTPTYLLGCKRILFSNAYLQALTKPNVHLHATGVGRIDGTTVHGTDGSAAAVDAIILATGFHILDMPLAERVRGVDGRSLDEYWAGSPEAYLGTVVAGFPNAFLVLGPSLGSGHSSAFTIAEAQIALIVQAIGAARDGDWAELAVRPEVQAAYIREVQAALTHTAYTASSCHRYFIDRNGRNSFSWPWSTGELVRRVSHFDAADFDVVAGTVMSA